MFSAQLLVTTPCQCDKCMLPVVTEKEREREREAVHFGAAA